ncbi:hypothetical protein PIB30_042429 [Stylosanthes scabra]|uniref:Uncharacterized protein n=1 Tax=Stylosanthes scabra TaxID=79078 RepID=A0ABU6RFA8_9FABA|nr:hypothetical protein [Stylosanthes scabra]
MKYTGIWIPDSSSHIKAAATDSSVIKRLRDSLKIDSFFINLKKGSAFLAEAPRKRDSTVNFPFSRWTSFKLDGLGNCRMALHFFGFASTPWVIMNPKNFPASIPKALFKGLRRILYLRKESKTSLRSESRLTGSSVFIHMSSI